MGREDSDEAYVLDLCDEVLGEPGLRQHTFDWLLGDPGHSGRRARLPVDSYWPRQHLVVEYRERQHDQPTAFFDKPDQLTVSGIHRGEQRALYDTRRHTMIPAQGLRLVIIRPGELDADARGRLRRRDREKDLDAVRGALGPLPQPAMNFDRSSTEPVTPLPRLKPGQKRGDEDRVVAAFGHWLVAQGWSLVVPTDPHTDIEAVRAGERLVGEAKGRTSSPGLDLDTLYGQLLRRMTTQTPDTRYAVIVPSSALWHAERVPAHVRTLLAIDLYTVAEDGTVQSLPR
jgi:hypothetical protein